jgi:Bacterial Ig domain/PA14 domain/Secretion system C-terminal sorting domain/Calx-beta domain/HYR domain
MPVIKLFKTFTMIKIYQLQKIFLFMRKNVFLFFLVLTFSIGKTAAQTSLSAGDIAIIGFNTDKSPDDIVVLVLKNLSAGTVFYINDNEVLTAGGTSFADLNEAEASFTVKAGQSIPAGTVIVLPWGGGLTSTATYDWSVTAGAGLGNNEEIYIYNAASITSLTPTSFIFGVTQGNNTGLIPNGLTVGTTWIDHGTLRAYRYNTTGATYTGTQAQLLAAIGNAANHTGASTYNFTPADWTFTVVPPAVVVNLSVSANAGTEAGTTAITVTATAASAVTGIQTVSLGVSGAGITAGDYTLSNTTISIPNGGTTGSVTFTIVDDILVEGTETATLTISSPSSGLTSGTVTTQNIIITDNDFAPNPTVNLSVSANAGTEAGATVITVTVEASAAVSGDQTVSLGVSGTGVTAGDYTLSNTIITILNGATTGTVTFTVVDDNLIEGTETAALTISNPSTGITLGATTTQNITITDNDIATVLAFNRVDTTVVEGVGIARVWLRVTTAGNTAGTVDLAVSNYSTATGADYTVPVTLNVPANPVLNQLISFDFTINDDAIAEADEYIICKLTNGSNVTFAGTAQSTLYIKDNDKVAPVANNQLSLNFVSSFNNGAAGTNSAEISAYDSASKRLFIANSVANKLDIVNLANPLTPVLITSVNIGTAFNGSVNSVAVKKGVVALALEGLTDKQANGKVVFVDINGTFISEAAAGAMPDMITFNNAGTKVYTANEGEPNAAYTIDPEGSITVVDISGGAASPIASTINFTAYIGQEAALRTQGIRIYGLNANAAQDFEPEYITISGDDTKAWVTLQENNALVELNLTNNTIVKLIPLGYKDHSATNNALDASDQTVGINLSNFPVKGMYLPDAIASYTSGGNVYLITANEGDARAYTGFNEESRISGLTLDPTAFPNSADLKNNGVLGRLNATNKTGDIDNDGDIDEIYVYGARSFSIWNPATSSQVYDSKDDLERITATNPLYSQFFNMSNTVANTAIKNRSDDKGPEPEGVTVAKIGGRDYAFVALERIGGVMVYDVTNPAAPAYVTYANSRTVAAGDRGAEGIIYIPAAQSPNGKSLVLLSNEISSTVSIFEIAPCAAPGIAAIASTGGTTACAGNTIKLFNVNSNAAYTYQWFKNDTTIAGATDSVYVASQSGNYKLIVFNAAGCVDTSATIALTIGADTIAPAITAPAAISVRTNDGCSAAGVNLGTPVASDNCGVASVTNNAPVNFPLGTTIVTWTVTDSSGNTATATQNVVVTDTTKPVIYFQSSLLAGSITGPNSSQTPYLKPFTKGTKFTSILTVGDAAPGGYKMVGIPDGLGAFDNNDGTFTLLMHHELGNTVGVPRAHGGIGAFVSKWVINKSDLSVVSGSDLMQQVFLWNPATNSYVPGINTAFSRFCSADLPAVSAFYNINNGNGTQERIFMGGEESGTEGRAVGHIVTGPNAGKSYELPYLGKFAWENSVAHPATGNKTVVAGLDDGTGGQVYFYIGTKTNTGTEIDKAGLNNGKLYGVKVTGLLTEVNGSTPAPGTRFEMADLGFVQNKTGTVLNTESVAAGVTTFLRPEDGAWDPNNPNDFYFATTNAFTSPSRLWRLRFDNAATPELGGTIEAVLDGTEGGKMYDNLTTDKKGHVFLQEDVGNNAHIGLMWQYKTATDSLFKIAYHDSTRFISGAPNFLTQDEETSGIIDMSDILGQGMFLFDDQTHYAIPGELVEGGQLLAMYHPLAFGNSTAPDTVRVSVPFGSTSATGVNLGTPATADNCSVASITNNAPSAFPLGTTVVTWTVIDGSGNTVTANQIVLVTVSANAAPVVSITSPISPANFPAGSTITATVTASDTDGTVNKVELFVNGSLYGEDLTAPYTFTGTNVEAGIYKVVAKATDNNGATALSDTLTITVTDCTGSGSISAEGYTNIPGSQVSDLTGNPAYPNNPAVVASLSSFEYSGNLADNYGARVRGYICAPETGNYTFYIAADNQAGLWLSTNDNPANKVLIAYTESATNQRDWYKFPSQKSVSISLFKGVRYYIETLHKEDAGDDHLAVAWVLPSGVFEGPIPGNRLSPFTSAVPTGSNFQIEMERADIGGLKVKATPNPSQSYFTINTRSNSDKTITVKVMDAMGRIVENRLNAAANGTLRIGDRLPAGIYFVEVTQGVRKERLKLVKQ